jgi:hypothetical protein
MKLLNRHETLFIENLRKFLTMIGNYLIIYNNVIRISLITIIFPRKIMRLKKFNLCG